MQRWAFQAHANPAMMLSHAAFLEGEDVEHLLENAYDEIFRLAGEGDHPGLWVQFAKLLGATDAELDEVAAKPLAEVIGFPRTMTHYCRKSAAEGLATWWGDEKQLPEAHGATALALTKYYGCRTRRSNISTSTCAPTSSTPSTRSSLFEGYVGDRGDVVRGRRAAAVTLWAWREMHDGILRYLKTEIRLLGPPPCACTASRRTRTCSSRWPSSSPRAFASRASTSAATAARRSRRRATRPRTMPATFMAAARRRKRC